MALRRVSSGADLRPVDRRVPPGVRRCPAFRCSSGWPSASATESFRARRIVLRPHSNTSNSGRRPSCTPCRAGSASREDRDALIQFDPFSFLADSSRRCSLPRVGNLFKVKLKASSPARDQAREGRPPRDLWCDSVGFDKTLVSGDPPPRPEPVVASQAQGGPRRPAQLGRQLATGTRAWWPSARSADGDRPTHSGPSVKHRRASGPRDRPVRHQHPGRRPVFRITDVAINGKGVELTGSFSPRPSS